MSFLQQALEAIPTVARSPLALIGLIAVLIAWAYSVKQIHRVRLVLRETKDLPPQKRAQALASAMEVPVPPKLSATQFIRWQKHKYIVIVVLAALLLVFLFGILLLWHIKDRHTQELLDKVSIQLGPPYQQAEKLPLNTTVLLSLDALPAGAHTVWRQPQRGTLTTLTAPAVRFTTTSPGAEDLNADVTWGGQVVRIFRHVDVEKPF